MPRAKPFDGYLEDARRRPVKWRVLGYATSLALHVPPLTLFAAAWLTQELVLEQAYDMPDQQRPGSIAYYEVPAHLYAGFPGGVALAREGHVNHAPLGQHGGRGGKAGHGRRRAQKPLVYQTHKPMTKRGRPLEAPRPVAHGPIELGDDHHEVSGNGHAPGHGTGATHHEDGDGEGHGRHGGAGSGSGAGGGLVRYNGGFGGTGSSQAAMGLWIPPEPKKKETVGRPRGKGDDLAEGEEGKEGEGDGKPDDTAVVGPPLVGRPSRVSMNFAAYLRTFDPLPTLPDSCWPPGRTTNTLLLEICVSEGGEVNDVVVRQSAGVEVDQHLTSSIRTWRYRPRVVQGSARPFCHPIRLVYTRQQRFGQW